MKKNVFVLALFCIVSMMANAEVAKYCMSYDDFVAGNWKSVDELTAGRTQHKDVSLETSKYVQAVRYDKNKLCIMSYRTDGLTALASLGTLVGGVLVNDTALSLTLLGTSIGCDIANSKLSDFACFLVDSGANEKGKTAITRINDDYMEQLLANDTPLLERYKAVKTKHNRQSAANILPILMEKGLVESAAN